MGRIKRRKSSTHVKQQLRMTNKRHNTGKTEYAFVECQKRREKGQNIDLHFVTNAEYDNVEKIID